ncbi:Alpha-L-arabinofuranosidase 1 [Vigna angularis]|uniref:Alpha-L-arabinofuranosidase 1 n=1 Tax=Phaseolus angularis TaxID=3914 RepID=A0A8T0L9X7_PHAAN|nr:Alpha-L-arabinofuranosidase 1 [Vigna angularis]
MSLIFHQNIEKAHKYKVVFFAKASGAVDLHVSFVGSDNTELASNNIGSFGHNGHGFRKDLAQRVADLKPKIFRFPDGKTAWEHGRRDLVTSETFGVIRPMMVLAILRVFKYIPSSPCLCIQEINHAGDVAAFLADLWMISPSVVVLVDNERWANMVK